MRTHAICARCHEKPVRCEEVHLYSLGVFPGHICPVCYENYYLPSVELRDLIAQFYCGDCARRVGLTAQLNSVRELYDTICRMWARTDWRMMLPTSETLDWVEFEFCYLTEPPLVQEITEARVKFRPDHRALLNTLRLALLGTVATPTPTPAPLPVGAIRCECNNCYTQRRR